MHARIISERDFQTIHLKIITHKKGKIEYGTRRRSPLWNNQLCPYIGVRRKNQPSAAAVGPA